MLSCLQLMAVVASTILGLIRNMRAFGGILVVSPVPARARGRSGSWAPGTPGEVWVSSFLQGILGTDPHPGPAFPWGSVGSGQGPAWSGAMSRLGPGAAPGTGQ